MAGWEDSSEEIYVESVEEFVDTNPDLYKQRTIAALNEKRYKDALKEAQLALKYGNQALEYHVLVMRVIFEMEQYEECFKYLTNSGMWDNRENSSLLEEERNFIYYVYAVCFQKCIGDITKCKSIFITPDGRGICTSLQQAIDSCKEGQEIILVDGCYEKPILGNHIAFCSGYQRSTQFKEEEISIDGKKIIIRGLGNIDFPAKITIQNANVELSGIKIRPMEDEKFATKDDDEDYIIIIKKSNVKLQKVSFHKGGISETREVSGMLVNDNSEVIVNNCSFHGLKYGVCDDGFSICILVTDGKVTINDSRFSSFKIGGVMSHPDPDSDVKGNYQIYITNSKFYDASGFGIASTIGYVEVVNCEIYNVGGGVFTMVNEKIPQSDGGECVVKNCNIYSCGINVGAWQGGDIRIESSTLSQCKECGIKATDNTRLELIDCTLKWNKKDIIKIGNPEIREIGVKRIDNNSVGSAFGLFRNFAISMKNIFLP